MQFLSLIGKSKENSNVKTPWHGRMLYHHTPYLLTNKRIILAFRRTGHGAFLTFAGCLLAVSICGMLIPTMMEDISKRETPQNSSVWVWRGSKNYVLTPVRRVEPMFPNEELSRSFNPNKSYYILGPGEDLSKAVYKLIKPADKKTVYKQISFYDPKGDLKSLFSTDFSKCEYRKCKIAKKIEQADAVVFWATRLDIAKLPTFKRKPGQKWVFHTKEAPTRYSFFSSFNKTNFKNRFNWTITYRNHSDIQDNWGYLKLKPNMEVSRDYDAIFEKKTKTAAWFASICSTRSRRETYVARMKARMDVDIYGECGFLQCPGSPKKVQPGQPKPDNTTCFPTVSTKYKFYLAFEYSMCREYVSDQFFKIFSTTNVDAVPVVRGGANYKKYFPADMYVDAADFATPEDLADYLVDLGNDKERYIRMLKAKDKWQAVPSFPEWQCSLCQKLHLDKSKKMYRDVVEWWTADQCHDDPVESYRF